MIGSLFLSQLNCPSKPTGVREKHQTIRVICVFLADLRTCLLEQIILGCTLFFIKIFVEYDTNNIAMGILLFWYKSRVQRKLAKATLLFLF